MDELALEKSIYRNYCEEYGYAIHPNNTPDWLDSVCIYGDWGAKYIEKNGKIMGIWPYFIKKKKGLTFLTEPPFTQFLGPYISYPDNTSGIKKLLFEKEIISSLFDEILKLKIDFISQQLIPEFTNWLPLYWKGCTQSTNYTYIRKDIRNLSENDLLQSYSNSARKTIVKFLNEGYSCLNATELNFGAEEFYELHKKYLYKTGKKISYEPTLLTKMVDPMIKSNHGTLLVILDPNKVICGVNFALHNEKECIGINSAVDHSIHGLGYFCKHKQLLFASSICDSYNIGGSMIKGVESVYSLFGGSLVPYFRIHKSISTKYKILDGCNQIVKAFK